jgi:hypothetical protein
MAALASARGHRDPETAAALVALLGVAGALYGPMVNRATGRDASDTRLYEATAEMLQDWLLGAGVRPTRHLAGPPRRSRAQPAVWPPSMLMAAPVT